MRLASFEEYFFADDRPSFPAVFYLTLRINSRIDRIVAQRAWERVVATHPLLRANVRIGQRGRPEWIESDVHQKIVWVERCERRESVDLNSLWLSMDISNGPTMRVYGIQTDPGYDLVIQGHHAAFDGIGTLQIVKDWLREYAVGTTNGSANTGAHDYETSLLTKRCRPSLTWKERLQTVGYQWKSVISAIQFMGRSAIPLVPLELEGTNARGVFGRGQVITHVFEVEKTNAIRARALRLKTTVNNLLTSDLFAAIGRWVPAGSRPPGSHYRVMIPFNERTNLHRHMPACNHCSIVSIERRPSELGDLEKLHAGIKQELDVIKRRRLSLNFWRALSVLRRLPGGLQRQVPDGKCSATCLLSNLGPTDVWFQSLEHKTEEDSTGLEVCDVEIVAPLRTGMYAAFTVASFRERIQVTIHYDDRVLKGSSGVSLMDLFIEQIENTWEDRKSFRD